MEEYALWATTIMNYWHLNEECKQSLEDDHVGALAKVDPLNVNSTEIMYWTFSQEEGSQVEAVNPVVYYG